MILSILIPSIPRHKELFDKLITELLRQCDGLGKKIEIVTNENNGTVGAKRQDLLKTAKGEYIVFIDADDEISENYIASIMTALKSKPDCVGIKGIMTTNGHLKKEWAISKDYQQWSEVNGVYLRHTNHLAPVKRSIALQVGFPNKTHGEDYDYSMGLRGLLHTEVKIEHGIYHYKYINHK